MAEPVDSTEVIQEVITELSKPLYALSKCVTMANLRSDDASRSQQTTQGLAKGRHFGLRHINKERLVRDRNMDLLKCETAKTREMRKRNDFIWLERSLIIDTRGQGADTKGGKGALFIS